MRRLLWVLCQEGCWDGKGCYVSVAGLSRELLWRWVGWWWELLGGLSGMVVQVCTGVNEIWVKVFSKVSASMGVQVCPWVNEVWVKVLSLVSAFGACGWWFCWSRSAAVRGCGVLVVGAGWWVWWVRVLVVGL